MILRLQRTGAHTEGKQQILTYYSSICIESASKSIKIPLEVASIFGKIQAQRLSTTKHKY